MDFSNIPTYLLKDVNEDPGEDVALLSVSFEDTEATQVYPKLYLSPRIEHALGGSSALHIPAFPGGGCLIDYVPQVCHLLTNKVQYVIQGYHKEESILLLSSVTLAQVSWNMMQKALQNSPCC